MKTADIQILMSIEDRVIAADIQAFLEESGIYPMLVSDNPAASVLITYSGLNPIECIDIQVNKDDYQKAVEMLMNSPYKELLG